MCGRAETTTSVRLPRATSWAVQSVAGEILRPGCRRAVGPTPSGHRCTLGLVGPETTIPSMRSAVLLAYRRVMSWAPIEKDAFLYLCATAFAVANAGAAIAADYREWGQMAGVTYGVGAVICGAVALLARRGTMRASTVSLVRRIVVAAVILGAVVTPLVAELVWRADARPGANVQSEVAVIERAGDRLAKGESPYLAHPTTVGVSPHTDAKSIDANSFYPYLPGMAPFGLANAAAGPPELTDACVTLVGFTLIVAAMALLVRGRDGRSAGPCAPVPRGSPVGGAADGDRRRRHARSRPHAGGPRARGRNDDRWRPVWRSVARRH